MEGPQQARADFDAWSVPVALPETGVLELAVVGAAPRRRALPVAAHRETAAWLRQRFLASQACCRCGTLAKVLASLYTCATATACPETLREARPFESRG